MSITNDVRHNIACRHIRTIERRIQRSELDGHQRMGGIMRVTLYYAGEKRYHNHVNLEKLINYMTIELQRVPNVGEEVSLMFDKYWINAKVAQVYTNWTERGNERFRESAWGDRYGISLTDIEIIEKYE